MGLISGSGRSPGVGNGNLLWYSCLENSTGRAWRATVHGVTNSQTEFEHAHTRYLNEEEREQWLLLPCRFEIYPLGNGFSIKSLPLSIVEGTTSPGRQGPALISQHWPRAHPDPVSGL